MHSSFGDFNFTFNDFQESISSLHHIGQVYSQVEMARLIFAVKSVCLNYLGVGGLTGRQRFHLNRDWVFFKKERRLTIVV